MNADKFPLRNKSAYITSLRIESAQEGRKRKRKMSITLVMDEDAGVD